MSESAESSDKPDLVQLGLGISDPWAEEWQGMPSFRMTPEVPLLTINVSFKTQADIDAFSKLIGQQVRMTTKNYWFPKLNRKSTSSLKYKDSE